MSGEDHVARAVFDQAASRYVQFVGTEISSATEGPIDRALLVAFELIKRQTVVRVADIGCGPGRVAAFMTERGLDVVGGDVSQAMLAVARTAHPLIKFRRVNSMPSPSKRDCSLVQSAGTRSSTDPRIERPRPDPASSYHLSTPLLGFGSENSGHDIDESLEFEDKLLLGHAFSKSWARAEGRRVAGKSAPKSDSTGESQTHSPRS
jgi:SAM-dependent methyltransferase